MQEYEIRILRADRTTNILFEGVYFTDRDAIRAAKKMAGARAYEVWRGLDCIYGGHLAEPPLPWPIRPVI